VHALSLKLPGLGLFDWDHWAVPVGALAVPADVSVTVAVHVAGASTATGLGEQRTSVFAERGPTDRVSLPLLFTWLNSPP